MPSKEPERPSKKALPEEFESVPDTQKPGGIVQKLLHTVGPLAAITAGLTAGCSPTTQQAPHVRGAAEHLTALQEETRQALHQIGIFTPEVREGVVHCTYNGRAYTLTINEKGKMQELRSGEVSAVFPTPIPHSRIGSVIQTFEQILRRQASHEEKDRAFVERLGPTKRFTDSDGNRFFFETGEGKERKKYCATPLEILEVTHEPSPADFANWQEKDAAREHALRACYDFVKLHGFGDRDYLTKEELLRLPTDALRKEYHDLSTQWSTAYGTVFPARKQCITTLRHPDYGEVTDSPYSHKRELGIFTRTYTKEGKKIEEWHWEEGISRRTTALGPKRELSERFHNWSKDEAEEYFFDDAWKRHTAWHETYRPNGTRISRREGNAIQYFGPDDRTVIAKATIQKSTKEQEYVVDARLTAPDQKGNPIGTYRQHLHTTPNLTPEEYIAHVAPALSRDPHLLQRYFRLYWRYTNDRTPDPKNLDDRWKPGHFFRPGEYQQTIHQTLLERQEGISVEKDQVPESLFGDCDDLSELAAYMLQSQGIRAYNIAVHFEDAKQSRSAHAICFWLEKRPDGRWNARSQCTFGAMKNGLPLDECPDTHEGYLNPEECFRALGEFYGRHGLRLVSCCKDRREGMNLQKIWHTIPTDTGKDQALTLQDFLPTEHQPLPSPEPGRLKTLLEKMGLPSTLIALSALPLGYLYLRWRKGKNGKFVQREIEPALPFSIAFDDLPKPKRGETYPDSKGVPWTIVEWDPPNIRLKMPMTMRGSLQRDGATFFLFVANVPLKSGKKLHVELRTPIDEGNIG